MSTEPTVAEGQGDLYDTANDRFKRSFGSWFWGSMVAAAFIHFAVIAFWPTLEASDVQFTMDELEVLDIPPEIEIPPPPEQISRPANPVITDAQIDEDITIAPTTFEDNPIDDLPPPPEQQGVDLSAQPAFTPFTVAPEIRNRDHLERLLEREYPAMLRDAGIGGRVVVHFFINTEGRVENSLLYETSGHRLLDEAALRIAPELIFSPARNQDQVVPVWVAIPITFRTR